MLSIFKKTSPGTGQGRDGSQAAAGTDRDSDGPNIVLRRHVDFIEHQIRWRWLMDSYEGGDRYRNAVYGPDRKGLPCRNLFRHTREYPDPQQFPNSSSFMNGGYPGLAPNNSGTDPGMYGAFPGMLGADPAATAQDDCYETRRARTPPPEFVAEAVGIHLSKVYDQEVTREGQTDLTEWWEDVDGCGTPIDDWMRETVAPLLLVLGCLDVCLDHPKAPAGQTVNTRADEQALGLDACCASVILPENMVWWRLGQDRRYTECLVREYADPSDRVDVDKKGNLTDPDAKNAAGTLWRQNYIRFRHWTATESTLYNFDGDKVLEPPVPHNFGRVPIIRLIDQKKHRSLTVGKSRYEAIAELQRAYYNLDSELILSDSLQAHPLLSGSKNMCKADNTLSIGPNFILPIDITPDGTVIHWEYVSPSKDPADSLRKNKQDMVDMKDRLACLTKPAGVSQGSGAGGGSSTVSQSGVSKQLDAVTGHKVLTAIAQSLAKAERFIAEYAMLVLRNGPPTPADMESLSVTYPAKFDLQSAGELTDGLAKIQTTAASAGNLPETEGDGLKAAMRQLLPGQGDEDYASKDAEIEELMAKKATDKQQQREAGYQDRSNVFGGGVGSSEQAAGSDPTGQSAGTQVGNMIPAVE